MKFFYKLISLCILLSISHFNAQDSLKYLKLIAYTDFYYSYVNDAKRFREKPNYFYNYKKINQVNVNLVLVKAAYQKNNIRANVALMLGNYPKYNLINEPSWAQWINELNIGYKVSKKHNLWLDLGVMNSHIGSESVADINSWTLTRGLAAENSPYYETGVKLSYISPSGKWFSSVMLLNGWQHIQQPKGIQQPSFGMQFYYQASERLLINYSNFIGSDKPDSFHVLRHFHDIYIIYQPSQDFGLSLGYDIGIEKTSKQKSQIWYSPIVVARYCIAKKLRLSARTEYFQDANQTLISTNTDYGFKVLSLSTNLDYSVTNQMIMKLESRSFHSKDLIFYNHQKQNKEFTIGLAIKW